MADSGDLDFSPDDYRRLDVLADEIAERFHRGERPEGATEEPGHDASSRGPYSTMPTAT